MQNVNLKRWSDAHLEREIDFANGFEAWKGSPEERAWYAALHNEANRRAGIDPVSAKAEMDSMLHTEGRGVLPHDGRTAS